MNHLGTTFANRLPDPRRVRLSMQGARMSISMNRFGASGMFPTYHVEPPLGAPVSVYILQCCNCGHEPENAVVAPRICPKCQGQSFERVTRPGSLLANAERY